METSLTPIEDFRDVYLDSFRVSADKDGAIHYEKPVPLFFNIFLYAINVMTATGCGKRRTHRLNASLKSTQGTKSITIFSNEDLKDCCYLRQEFNGEKVQAGDWTLEISAANFEVGEEVIARVSVEYSTYEDPFIIQAPSHTYGFPFEVSPDGDGTIHTTHSVPIRGDGFLEEVKIQTKSWCIWRTHELSASLENKAGTESITIFSNEDLEDCSPLRKKFKQEPVQAGDWTLEISAANFGAEKVVRGEVSVTYVIV